MFARHDLNKMLDIQVWEVVQDAAKVLGEALDGINGQSKSNLWKALPCISPIQTFLAHIMHFMSNQLKDSSSY